MELTTHAKRRFKERLHLPARAARKAAEDAIRLGLDPDRLHPALRARTESMMNRHDPHGQTFIKVHKGHGFIFARKAQREAVVLITVLPHFNVRGMEP